MRVTLTADQASWAIRAGNARQENAVNRKLRDAHGLKTDNPASFHILGYAGEIAVSVALGAPLPDLALDDFYTRPDVANFCDVRTCRYDLGDLRVHPNDKDDRPYVLAIGVIPNFWIVGWLYGREAKRQEWWKSINPDRPPAFFAPQSCLRTLSELIEVRAGKPIGAPPDPSAAKWKNDPIPPGGLTETTACRIFARYGYWPETLSKTLIGAYGSPDIPPRFWKRVDEEKESRVWELP